MNIDLAGKIFGRLIVLSEAPRIGKRFKDRHWLCRCSCGKEKIIYQGNLTQSKILSCGCLHRENHLIHGLVKTRTYRIWQGMKGRCQHPRNDMYQYYGARGIKVCERWLTFANFLADMGVCPSTKHSIDRINNNGNYEPSNCRWSTSHAQSRNTSRNIFHEWQGERIIQKDLAAKYNLHDNTLQSRLNRGWALADALLKPVQNQSRRVKK